MGPFFGLGIASSPQFHFGAGVGIGAFCGVGFGAGLYAACGSGYLTRGKSLRYAILSIVPAPL